VAAAFALIAAITSAYAECIVPDPTPTPLKVRTAALVQTFGINVTKRSGTLLGSCGENSIPDFGRPVVLDAKLSECELTFPDSVHQFNAGDGN